MRRIFPAVILAVVGGALALADAAFGAAAPVPAERFTFIAMGCMPYGEKTYADFERLLAEVNRHKPAFTLHVGDTKAGSEPPTEAYYVRVRDWFNTVDGPLIYTPGDNEWTDVNAPAAGAHDPLVWLAKVRALYFPEERSLGRAPMPLVTQRRDPAFAKFVENARWTHGGVVFATVHVVGSNNNFQPNIPGAVEEFKERDAANAAWVKAAFAEARTNSAPGIALIFQAEPFATQLNPRPARPSGFTLFLETVEAEARAFAKPVLLVHADAHRHRIERGMVFRPGGEPLKNVTRVETFGEVDIHAVVVLVDPASRDVFLPAPLLIPGNPLPVLPRPPATPATRAK
jgi:hypothetical protein